MKEVSPPPLPIEEPEAKLPEKLPPGYKWVIVADPGPAEPTPELDWSRRAVGEDGLVTYGTIDLLQLPKAKALSLQAAFDELSSTLVAEARPRISELQGGESGYVIDAFAKPMDDAFQTLHQSVEQLTTLRKADWLIASVKDTNDYPGWGVFQLEINFQRSTSPNDQSVGWSVVRIDPETGERKGSLTGRFDERPGRNGFIEDLFTVTAPDPGIRTETSEVSSSSLTIEPLKLRTEMRAVNNVD